MRPLAFVASERHYVDHLAPLWHALPPDGRGPFWCSTRQAYDRATARGVPAERWRPGGRALKAARRYGHVAVAGWGDTRLLTWRPRLVLCEHGAGQSYTGTAAGHPHYAGGRQRDRVDVFLCPSWPAHRANEAVARPGQRVVMVGPMRLDPWLGRPRQARDPDGPPTVAVSFHWNCNLVPETRWAFPHYADAVETLADDTGMTVVGHAHPRAWPTLRAFYEKVGIPAWPDFDTVLDSADVYVCDNSSTLYEFAATGRPVVVLNAPWYRRDVRHGLRFWEYADVGVNVSSPAELAEAVRWADLDLSPNRDRRNDICHALFGRYADGRAAPRAAELLEDVLP